MSTTLSLVVMCTHGCGGLTFSSVFLRAGGSKRDTLHLINFVHTTSYIYISNNNLGLIKQLNVSNNNLRLIKQIKYQRHQNVPHPVTFLY
jgi:hypothetical protein